MGAEDKQKWNAEAGLMRYSDCIAQAAKLGFGNVFWDWDAPRSREGYYKVIGGIDYSAVRAVAFSPVSDIIWMETGVPSVADCKSFSDYVHAQCPHQMLAYNLSPSFNWDAAGMKDQDIINFQADIGRLGFTWQFITLA